jgi:charged multivesicular body protein 5
LSKKKKKKKKLAVMHRLFGSKKEVGPAQPAPNLEDATNRAGQRADHLQQKVDGCDAELVKMKAQLQKTRSPQLQQQIKRRMMQVLQRKRMYVSQQDTLRTQQFNMEAASFSIESMKDTAHTIAAVREAQSQMQTQLKAVSIDDIENLQDELEDLMLDSHEIQEALGRSYSVPDLDIDEADLEAELDALGDLDDAEFAAYTATPSYASAEATANSPSSVPSYLAALDDYGLPSVPTATPATTAGGGNQGIALTEPELPGGLGF